MFTKSDRSDRQTYVHKVRQFRSTATKSDWQTYVHKVRQIRPTDVRPQSPTDQTDRRMSDTSYWQAYIRQKIFVWDWVFRKVRVPIPKKKVPKHPEIWLKSIGQEYLAKLWTFVLQNCISYPVDDCIALQFQHHRLWILYCYHDNC